MEEEEYFGGEVQSSVVAARLPSIRTSKGKQIAKNIASRVESGEISMSNVPRKYYNYVQGEVQGAMPVTKALSGPDKTVQALPNTGFTYYYPDHKNGKLRLDIIDNVTAFQNGVYENATRYQQQFNVDHDTYQRLGKLAVALMGRESSFSNFQNGKLIKPADAAEIYHNLSEMAKQAINIQQNVTARALNWIPGVNIPKTEVGWNPKVASRGSTQIKFPRNWEPLRTVYNNEGITKDSLEGSDYVAQGQATILKLLDLYNQYRDDINAGIFRDVHTRAPGIEKDQEDAMRAELYSQYKQERANNELANGLYTMPGTSRDEYWQRTPLKMETILGQLWRGVSGDGIFNMTETGDYTTGLNRMLNNLSVEKPKYLHGGVFAPIVRTKTVPSKITYITSNDMSISYINTSSQFRNGGVFFMANGGGTKFEDNDRVAAIQEFLISQGYNLGASGADGKLGDMTKKAIMAFQKSQGLVADGKWGYNTQDLVNQKFKAKAPAIIVNPGEHVGKRGPNSGFAIPFPAIELPKAESDTEQSTQSAEQPAKASMFPFGSIVSNFIGKIFKRGEANSNNYKTSVPELQTLSQEQIQALNKHYGLEGNAVTKELEDALVKDMYRGLTGYTLSLPNTTNKDHLNNCATYVHRQIRYSLGRGRGTGDAQMTKGQAIGNDLGINGNAWTHGDSIVQRGGTKLFDLYDDPSITALGVKPRASQIRTAVKNLWGKSWSPDISALQIGDVVELFYDRSGEHENAAKEAGRARNTHTGLIVGRDAEGNPIVSHNIHGQIYNEVLKRGTTQGGFVTGAYRPNYGKYGFLSAMKYGGRALPTCYANTTLLRFT